MADDLDFSGLKKKSKRTAKVNFDESTLETNEAPAQAEQTQVGETENGEDFDAFSDLKKKSKKKKSIPADFVSMVAMASQLNLCAHVTAPSLSFHDMRGASI